MAAVATPGESFARGSMFAGAGAIWKLLLQLLGLVVLSRLVPPADFGAMAILVSIAGVALLLGDFGLSTAALRAPRLTQQQRSNLFWVNVALGILFWGGAILLAPPIAAAFSAPSLEWGLPLVASTVFFTLAGAQSKTEINRRGEFSVLTWVEGLAGLVGVAVAIGLALAQMGLLALVAQQVAYAIVASSLFLLIAKWKPSLPRYAAGMKEFWTFGAYTLATQAVTFLSNNADIWLIGKVWGLAPLGQYSRATQLAKLPVSQLLPPLARVALPHLRGLDPWSPQFTMRISRWQGGVTQPLIYGLALIAASSAPLVEIVLGSAWTQSALLVPPLVLAASFQVLGNPYYWALLAVGDARAIFRSEAIGRLLMVIAMLAVVSAGVPAIAWAGAGGFGCVWLLQMRAASRVSGLSMGHGLVVGLRYLLVGGVAYVAAKVLSWTAGSFTGPVGPVTELLVLLAGWLLAISIATVTIAPIRRDLVLLRSKLRQLRRGS